MKILGKSLSWLGDVFALYMLASICSYMHMTMSKPLFTYSLTFVNRAINTENMNKYILICQILYKIFRRGRKWFCQQTHCRCDIRLLRVRRCLQHWHPIIFSASTQQCTAQCAEMFYSSRDRPYQYLHPEIEECRDRYDDDDGVRVIFTQFKCLSSFIRWTNGCYITQNRKKIAHARTNTHRHYTPNKKNQKYASKISMFCDLLRK